MTKKINHTYIRTFDDIDVAILVLRNGNLWAYEVKIGDDEIYKSNEKLFLEDVDALNAGCCFVKDEIKRLKNEI